MSEMYGTKETQGTAMSWLCGCCGGHEDANESNVDVSPGFDDGPKNSLNANASEQTQNPRRIDKPPQRTTFLNVKRGLMLYGLAILCVSYVFNGWVSIFTSPLYSHEDIPDLHGKFAVVTGANTGIGRQTVLELARKGCHVILASRSKDRGLAALADIESQLQDTDSGEVR